MVKPDWNFKTTMKIIYIWLSIHNFCIEIKTTSIKIKHMIKRKNLQPHVIPLLYKGLLKFTNGEIKIVNKMEFLFDRSTWSLVRLTISSQGPTDSLSC